VKRTSTVTFVNACASPMRLARVPDGMEVSADPILNFRPRAYAVSVQRRSGAPIPEHLA